MRKVTHTRGAVRTPLTASIASRRNAGWRSILSLRWINATHHTGGLRASSRMTARRTLRNGWAIDHAQCHILGRRLRQPRRAQGGRVRLSQPAFDPAASKSSLTPAVARWTPRVHHRGQRGLASKENILFQVAKLARLLWSISKMVDKKDRAMIRGSSYKIYAEAN